VGFVATGDVIGLSGDTHLASVEATSELRGCRFPRGEIQRLLDSEPGFARHVYELTTRELTEARRQMIRLGSNTAMERVASYLLDLDRQKTGTIEVPPRRDMASYLGLTVETTSRCMSKLRDAGAVSAPPRGAVMIHDRAMLAGMAA
jgi:CRP-like cAMP-binding protein